MPQCFVIHPKPELPIYLPNQELENILSSFKMDKQFRMLKKRKEKAIQPFGELDETGRDKKQGYAVHADADMTVGVPDAASY